MSYTNSKVDDLLHQVSNTNDPDIYESAMKEIDRIVFEEQPMTFILHPPVPYAFSNRLRGVKFSARGPFLFSPGVEGWWVPRE